ncbi:hypothetical protein BH10PSE15_BH10PSE15_10640 [soil metagenome]
MKSARISTEFSPVPATTGRRATRALWAVAPPVEKRAADDLGHETEVVRALSLAVPISLLLWVPLIWTAFRVL